MRNGSTTLLRSVFLIVPVALAACGNPEIVKGVHYTAAAVMFGVLAFFCGLFYRRAMVKGPHCGLIIAVFIVFTPSHEQLGCGPTVAGIKKVPVRFLLLKAPKTIPMRGHFR